MSSPIELAKSIDDVVRTALDENRAPEDKDEDCRVIDSLLRSRGIVEAIQHIQRETSLYLEGYLDGQSEFKAVRYALPYQDPFSYGE
jgi:hypothetical protein